MRILLLILLISSCSQAPKVNIGECVQKADRNDSWKVLKIESNLFEMKNTRTNEVAKMELNGDWMISACQ